MGVEFVVINVGTGEYEIDAEDLAASRRAKARFPDNGVILVYRSHQNEPIPGMVYGIDRRSVMNGKSFRSALITFWSAVISSQPSRSARAT